MLTVKDLAQRRKKTRVVRRGIRCLLYSPRRGRQPSAQSSPPRPSRRPSAPSRRAHHAKLSATPLADFHLGLTPSSIPCVPAAPPRRRRRVLVLAVLLRVHPRVRSLRELHHHRRVLALLEIDRARERILVRSRCSTPACFVPPLPPPRRRRTRAQTVVDKTREDFFARREVSIAAPSARPRAPRSIPRIGFSIAGARKFSSASWSAKKSSDARSSCRGRATAKSP